MMKETPASNYDRLCEEWRLKFLGMNQTELCRRLPELRREDGYLTLRHFGRKYGIDVRSGEILALEDSDPVTYTVKLNIYTLFWYVRPDVHFTGEWLPFVRLPGAGPFGPAFQKSVIDAYAATFSGKANRLRAAFEALGGRPLEVSDVGYELKGFDCIPVRFYFWDADDEFPAQANLLFDRSATDFIHVESVVTIASEGIRRIAEAAGIELIGGAL